MNGYHGRFWGVVLPYLPAALPGVTVPFLLPRLTTDLTLFLKLRIREYAQLQPKGAPHA